MGLIFQTALNLNDLWKFGGGKCVCVCVCVCLYAEVTTSPLKSEYAATRLNWRFFFFLNCLNDLIEYCSYLRLKFLTRIEALPSMNMRVPLTVITGSQM